MKQLETRTLGNRKVEVKVCDYVEVVKDKEMKARLVNGGDNEINNETKNRSF